MGDREQGGGILDFSRGQAEFGGMGEIG